MRNASLVTLLAILSASACSAASGDGGDGPERDADAAEVDAALIDVSSTSDGTSAADTSNVDAPGLADGSGGDAGADATADRDADVLIADATVDATLDAADRGDANDGGALVDAKDAIADIVISDVFVLPTECDACVELKPTPHMPDSLQPLCTDGGAFGACPTAGAPLYGQDGNFVANTPTYTKASGTVYDSVSGLMWEQTFAAGSFTRAQASERCDTLNKIPFAGFDDWRLPTAYEVLTLADTSRNLGLSPSVFSGHKQNSCIWTLDDSVGIAGTTFQLGLNWNVMVLNPTTSSIVSSSFCVRGNVANGGFSVSASGNVVTDARTSLKWQRAMAPGVYTWSQALAYCSALTIDGAGGYRLPSYKELWSTIDVTKSEPAVDTVTFPGTPVGSMWTSSPVVNSPTKAIVVETAYGRAYNFDVLQSTALSVRCVAGG